MSAQRRGTRCLIVCPAFPQPLVLAPIGLQRFSDVEILKHPDAVQGFLRAFLRGLRETVKQPAVAIESVLKRNGQARKNVELERLNMAIRENIVTPEVKADGYGGIDGDRFARALDQIALTHKFKVKPKPDDIFDSSFLPAAGARKYN